MKRSGHDTPLPATLIESFGPLWPGDAPRWVYTVREGIGGAGRVLHTVALGADESSRERSRASALEWCVERGYDAPIEVHWAARGRLARSA